MLNASFRSSSKFLLVLFAAFLVLATLPDAYSQESKRAKPKSSSPKPKTTKPSPSEKQRARKAPVEVDPLLFDHYRIAGLGSAEPDSSDPFPIPMAVLEIPDTAAYQVVVRFPGLGILGIAEDTITEPDYSFGDKLFGYQSRGRLYQLWFPKTPYEVYVDVFKKRTGELVDSRPLPYQMNVEKYRKSRIDLIHEARTGMGNMSLRRQFAPDLLPLTIEANPGWRVRETLDSAGVYALSFKDPTKQGDPALTLTMRPVVIARIDSATWEMFKDNARVAFGSLGIAVNSLGDFKVEDEGTRALIPAGYEFLSQRGDGGVDYVATYLTPHAVIMLMATIPPTEPAIMYDYFRAIARSLRLKG